MTLWRRLGSSDLLADLLARPVAGWLRLCAATTRWDWRGTGPLEAALAEGPVMILSWHECSTLAVVHWRPDWGPATTLRDTSPAGRLSGAIQRRFGKRPIAISRSASNLAASREVLRRLAEGDTVGLTGDGPAGPVRVLKEAGLDWARASGRPVFLYAFAMRRQRRLKTWDRMIWPLPFGRGVVIYRRWDGDMPRRADAEAREAARRAIEAALTEVTEAAAAACV